MQASDVMSRDIVTVGADDHILTAIDAMLKRHVSALPVVDEAGKPIGLISQTDLLHRAELDTGKVDNRFWSRFEHEKCAEDYARFYGRLVRDVMTAGVCSVGVDASLSRVVEIMETSQIRRVMVLDGGRLVGMVSRTDLVRALRDRLKEPRIAQSDVMIKSKIMAELRRMQWAPHDAKVEVSDGVVTLDGVARDEADIKALRAMAEAVSGVKSVTDKLFLLNPGTGYSRPGDLGKSS